MRIPFFVTSADRAANSDISWIDRIIGSLAVDRRRLEFTIAIMSLLTCLEVILPEFAWIEKYALANAVRRRYTPEVESKRKALNANKSGPNSAQLTAVHLGLLAVKGAMPPREDIENPASKSVLSLSKGEDPSTAYTQEYLNVLQMISEQPEGWNKPTFHEYVQPGYRIVTVKEATFIPGLLDRLPKGSGTFMGYALPQVATILLLLQVIWFIVYVVARLATGMYVTALELWFLPSAGALLLLRLAGVLHHPAWKEIAHIDVGVPHLRKYGRRSRLQWFHTTFLFILTWGPWPVVLACGWLLHEESQPAPIVATLRNTFIALGSWVIVIPVAALAGLVWGPGILQLLPEIGDPLKVHTSVRHLLSLILIVMRCVVLGYGKRTNNRLGILVHIGPKHFGNCLSPRTLRICNYVSGTLSKFDMADKYAAWAQYIPHI
ncbi:hypothetical protein FRC11_005069 [Ceratobasidium sp. 423]|nr:hypothetical protein FRC11_005069 [Ceratobasidium sp. 423]